MELKFLSVGCGDGIIIRFLGNDKGYKKKGNYYIPPQEDPFELKYDRTENRIYAEMPIMLAPLSEEVQWCLSSHMQRIV